MIGGLLMLCKQPMLVTIDKSGLLRRSHGRMAGVGGPRPVLRKRNLGLPGPVVQQPPNVRAHGQLSLIST